MPQLTLRRLEYLTQVSDFDHRQTIMSFSYVGALKIFKILQNTVFRNNVEKVTNKYTLPKKQSSGVTSIVEKVASR